MRKSVSQEASPDLTEALPPKEEPKFVDIPEDFAANEAMMAHAMERKRLHDAATDATEVWSRSSEKQKGETDHAHQERIKAEFEAAVLAVRRQESAPPPPPQQVPRAISEQTAKEMAVGAKQSQYWAEQQKQRPHPNARDLQAAGHNTPVFRPGEYMHEKGSVDKQMVSTKT